MALSKKPVNGMKDILPAEMEIRDYVTSVIKDTYRSFGFTPIETPCMENIANLSNKQGGENEKLIFKVLKRGEKLNLETAKEEADVVDFGMRYDLTVPLSRFYANHANDLPTPFKALQIGSVWRADRPQRGRYRQFTQCDIDILGEPSNLAEIELITATTTTIGRLGFKNFEIRINERRILKAMAAYSGFEEKDYDSNTPLRAGPCAARLHPKGSVFCLSCRDTAVRTPQPGWPWKTRSPARRRSPASGGAAPAPRSRCPRR